MQVNIDKVGMPQWTDEEQTFAKAVQRLAEGKEDGLPKTAKKLEAPAAKPESGGSDDIGDDLACRTKVAVAPLIRVRGRYAE